MILVRFRRLLAVCCVLLVTGCGLGSSTPEPTPTSEPTVEPTSTPTVEPEWELELQPPVWTDALNTDGSPAEPLEWASTSIETIYAVFETGRIQKDTTFEVTWIMNGVVVPGLNPSLSITTDTPPGWIEIHLNRTSEDPWPDGVLEVQLAVNGEIVSSGSIELRDR